eukprot:1156361-Pelagomonas_calceolata.AAC.10
MLVLAQAAEVPGSSPCGGGGRPFKGPSRKFLKGLRGGGPQPENLADRLLESIDLEISQNVKARQERNKTTGSVWKLGKSM